MQKINAFSFAALCFLNYAVTIRALGLLNSFGTIRKVHDFHLFHRSNSQSKSVNAKRRSLRKIRSIPVLLENAIEEKKRVEINEELSEGTPLSYLNKLVRRSATKFHLCGIFILAVLSSIVASCTPLFIARVNAILLNPINFSEALFRKRIYVVALLYLMESLITYFFVKSFNSFGSSVMSTLKFDAFKSIIHKNVAHFDSRKVTEVSNPITTDMSAIKNFFQSNAQRDRGLRAVLESVFGISTLIVIQPKLAAIFLLVVPPVSLFLTNIKKDAVKAIEDERKSILNESGVIQEAVQNIREVKSFGAEKFECEKFGNFVRSTENAIQSLGRVSGKMESLNRGAIYLTIISVIWRGSILVSRGQMEPAMLISFVGYCYSLNFALQGINYSIADMQRAWSAFIRIHEAIEACNTVEKTEIAQKKVPKTLDITFSKVNFTYPTRKLSEVLRNIDLKLESGQTTALVGRSGAGKSTITALLMGFYQPVSGTVTIGDINFKDIDRSWLIKNTALVSQNPSLFSGSIASNIAYGYTPSEIASDSSLESRIRWASERANAHEFIEEFPEGYNTYVGSMGTQLSGGQLQRIAIARAVFKDAPILLLDEATSALDAHSEMLVQGALERLMTNRTVLVIAHRLSTIIRAHRIYVLDGGRVVESGSHESLLRRNGFYAELIRTQLSSREFV